MIYLKKYEDYKFPEDLEQRRQITSDRFKENMTILDYEDTLKYIQENCTEFLESPKHIYRVIDINYADYFHSKPIYRISRDNKNYYTLIIDKWKDFPKRSKSFICSTNMADFSGKEKYFIIPKDGSKWALAPSNDIWSSFHEGMKKYLDANLCVNFIFNKINNLSTIFINKKIRDDNYENFKTDLKLLSDKIKNYDFETKNINFKLSLIYKVNEIITLFDNNIIDVLLDIINPRNFGLYNYKDLPDDDIKETWTESECLFIKKEHLSKILNDLDVKYF